MTLGFDLLKQKVQKLIGDIHEFTAEAHSIDEWANDADISRQLGQTIDGIRHNLHVVNGISGAGRRTTQHLKTGH